MPEFQALPKMLAVGCQPWISGSRAGQLGGHTGWIVIGAELVGGKLEELQCSRCGIDIGRTGAEEPSEELVAGPLLLINCDT
jgi:hypothetical protein